MTRDRRYLDAPYLDEHAASTRYQDAAPRGFGELLHWFLEGFAVETPEAIHAIGTWFGRPPRPDEDLASYRPPDPDAPPAEPEVLSDASALTGGSVLGAPRQAELFRQLLEYNARELVHGSYGLEGDHIVLTDTLELENLDFSEFEASFDSITLALASHLATLAPYRER